MPRSPNSEEQSSPTEDANTMPNSSHPTAPSRSTYLPLYKRLIVDIPESYIVTISGGLAGAASGIVSCPLDVIKTKLQAQGGFKLRQSREVGFPTHSETYYGVKGTARSIWRDEGVRGMYRGLGPMLLGYVPTWAVYLTVYNRAQGYFATKTDNTFVANMYASLCAGTCSTLVTNPIWVIKTRLMSQGSSKPKGNHPRAPWHYRNTIDAARKMYLHEGFKSFYSGLTPALLGLTHVAIQFPLYEVFKVKFTGIDHNQPHSDEERAAHFWGLSAAVFVSKVIASAATYPHEVVRTRLQTQQRRYPESSSTSPGYGGERIQKPARISSSDGMINTPRYRGTVETCKLILREEGWRGFYAGLGTNLIRAVPSAMTTILTFEYLKAAFFTVRTEAAEMADS